MSSFSLDLLDGFDLLNKRTEGVLKSCADFSDFYKSLAKVEREYAKNLQKLSQSQKKDLQKASPSQKELGSTASGWDTTLSELEKIAEHHNQVADKIENDICKAIQNYTKEKSKNRKKLETDSQKIVKDMKTALENLQKARSKYVSLSKEAEAAEAVHTKGKNDVNMKPSQLAKLAAKSTQAADRAAAADNEYQTTLSATNQKQTETYTQLMPALLQEYQQFEEDRIAFMKQMAVAFANYNNEKPNMYSATCQAITSALQSITVETDIQAFISENKTGVTVPPNIEYASYDSEVPSANASKPKSAPAPKPTTNTKPGKIGKYKGAEDVDPLTSKEWGLTESARNLSSEEQQSILSGQLEELDKRLASEHKTKDGLENLVRFYASDPVAQKKAEEQIVECDNKIKKAQSLRNLVQSQLDQLLNGGTVTYSSGSASVIKARGLYDYNATCDTELSFKEGEILTVTEQDDSGWWYATLNGNSGFVPNNYVEVINS